MKEKKIEVRFFSITDYEEEAEYLRSRHKNGWKLRRVTLPGIYYFTKCDPEDVVYQLDYNEEGRKNKPEYIQMFRDCEWEYLFDFVGYSYFRKPVAKMSREEEIFCDDDSKLDMMKRVFKGRMLPLIIIFFCFIIPEFILQWSSRGIMSLMTISYGAFLLLYVGIFLKYAVEYRRYREKLRG